MSEKFDAISLEIYWSKLIAVADEAATTLLRTAFSPIIRESNDFATCLMNLRGETLAECSGGIPAFAGLLGRACRSILERFPLETWREGDCVFTNDPWIATGHLPDIALIAPVFHNGRLVAFSGTAAHAPDIGGSVRPDNREIYEEGVCIPPIHLYRAGVREETMLRLFLNNVRHPDLILGDIEAQVTANQVCRKRASDFLADTGLEDFEDLSRELHAMSEQSMRRAIAAVPDGVYSSSVRLDGAGNEPTEIECRIAVEGDGMTVDYAGTSPQVASAINCTMNYTQAYSIYPLKCILDPYSRRNEGSYRPIRVVAPEGCILNARHPAPVAARHLSGHALSCAIYQALADVLPDRVLADSGGAPAMRILVGGHDDRGERYSTILFASAGMGASSRADGLSTTAFPTNSGAGSIEILEATSPLLFKRKEFRRDSGGAGKYRGGLGQTIEIENRAGTPAQIVIVGERAENPAHGILGGLPGAAASAAVSGVGTVGLKSRNLLKSGSTVTFEFAGGGGYGDPAERDAAAIERDLELDLVSGEATSLHYNKKPEASVRK
ncbi:hydantoinase B/oxoprolinase family protein [uncultured Parvibaculum sp.]|uniref:hydantoinase B/oxoprolinase family protein n=2 Tax=Parvibaculum TaxID=256616 RepID=UPI0030D8C1E7